MMVNTAPREDVAVRFKYWVNDKGIIIQDQDDDNLRRDDLVHRRFCLGRAIALAGRHV
jgi:hypothetical protein